MKKVGGIAVRRKTLGSGAAKAIAGKPGVGKFDRSSSGFWALADSFKSKIRLTDEELRKTRQKFSESWGS